MCQGFLKFIKPISVIHQLLCFISGQLSVSAKKLSPARPGQITSEHVDSHVTKMTLTLTFGKQSLFLASADGSLKVVMRNCLHDVKASVTIFACSSITFHSRYYH